MGVVQREKMTLTPFSVCVCDHCGREQERDAEMQWFRFYPLRQDVINAFSQSTDFCSKTCLRAWLKGQV